MKKNSFIEGTIIATLAIVIVKILGIVYVIPFYATVGVQGAILYAYAYNIYSLFLEISTIGIPNAVSKLINEFNTLNKQEAKVRAFKIGKNILMIIAFIAFLIMFIFAKQIAVLILGDLRGGNTPADVAFVIRCVSFAILVFPFLSVTRGFFQGHNIIYVSSFSQVIEQVARVIVILGGSYLAIKVLHLEIRTAIGIAVFGAFIGGACALIYVYHKLNKNKKALHLTDDFKEKDAISNKEIIKKIITYAIPTIVISVAFILYNNVDMILILRTMNNLGFKASDVEFIASGISTWSTKISAIVTSMSLGLSASLVPAMVEAFTLKKYDEVNHKFNKAIEMTLFISLPMCIGISFLSDAIWSVFYGYNSLGTNILMISIFAPLFTNLYSVSNYTLQSINRFKLVYISAIVGILTNAILDVPFMYLFNFMHLPPYWGATLATSVGFSITLIIAMYFLRKEYNFRYGEILKVLRKILIPLITMSLVVFLLKYFINVDLTNKFMAIIYIAIISIGGAFIYFIISYKLGLFDEVLGKDFFKKLKNKFKKKRSN